MSDYLPPEILIHIFLRLPTKSLFQVCCVCKSWYSLISNPYFVSMHTHFTITTANNNFTSKAIPCCFMRRYSKLLGRELFNLVYDDDENENNLVVRCQELHCPFKSNLGSFEVVGSCYGLVCLIDSNLKYYTYRKPIILWNPSMGKFLTLPARESDNFETIHGFGFDFKRFDYKVVRIVYGSGDSVSCLALHEIDVFELSKGVWRSIRNKFPPSVPYCITQISSPAFANGAIHWIAYKQSNGGDYKFEIMIVAFDVGDEEFRVLELPDEIAARGFQVGMLNKLTLLGLGNPLCLIYWVQNVCHMWVMKECGSGRSWTKLYNVCLPGGCLKVLGIRRNGEILLVMHYGELVSYNPESGRISPLKVYGDPSSFFVDANYLEVLTLWKGCDWISGRSSTR